MGPSSGAFLQTPPTYKLNDKILRLTSVQKSPLQTGSICKSQEKGRFNPTLNWIPKQSSFQPVLLQGSVMSLFLETVFFPPLAAGSRGKRNVQRRNSVVLRECTCFPPAQIV